MKKKSQHNKMKKKPTTTGYKDLPAAQRILDFILLIAVCIAVGTTIAHFITKINNTLLLTMDIIILTVFFADATRNYFTSRGFIDYLRYHWFDLAVLAFMAIFFSSLFYLGTGRVLWLARNQLILQSGRMARLGVVRQYFFKSKE